jgi:predicted PurR-regulated permease PerM
MLGFDRKAARYVWTAALVLLSFFLIYLIGKTLFVFVLAVLFAYLLSPLVNLLDRFLPTRTRTPALAGTYVIFVGLAVLLMAQIGSRVTEEAGALAKDFPAQMAKWEQPSPDLSPEVNKLRTEIVDRARREITEGSHDLLANLAQAGIKAVTVATDLIYVVIVPILAFFFLKDGRVIREHVLDLVDDGPRRVLLDDLMADVHLLLAHYMRALVLLSLAAFTAFSIAFSIMGVPYSVLLAAIGGLLEFIPMLGPLTAGILIVVVSAVSGAHVLGVIIFLLAYRVFQDYILSPHLMGQGVELHPLLVLFGVFAGAEAAGIPGTFLSVPVLALVRIVYLRIRKARVGAQLRPVRPAGPIAL